MTQLKDYPGVSSFLDRHGKRRYRYRHKGKTKSIPGEPRTPQFDEYYHAIIEGREPNKASVTMHPRAALPRSLAAAWRGVLTTPEWGTLNPATKYKNTRLAEELLFKQIAAPDPMCWKDVQIQEIKRRHVKMILTSYADTPHKAKHVLVTLRKMVYFAIDEDWIEDDPTLRMRWNPPNKGWRAWTASERDKYEAYWPLGSKQRTVYSIALWLGLRVSDIPGLLWSNVDSKNKRIVAEINKGNQEPLILPISPMLEEALNAIERTGDYILMTDYGDQFSHKSLTNNMQAWTKKARLPPGCTTHGLRKTLGKIIAEAGGTTRELMDSLGHKNIAHAELYSREAEQERLARNAMDKVVQFRKRDG